MKDGLLVMARTGMSAGHKSEVARIPSVISEDTIYKLKKTTPGDGGG